MIKYSTYVYIRSLYTRPDGFYCIVKVSMKIHILQFSNALSFTHLPNFSIVIINFLIARLQLHNWHVWYVDKVMEEITTVAQNK